MSEKVHYEDNLFFLLTDITRLKNGLKLSIDNDFFARKILEDLFFIDASLSCHYQLLKENPYLIRRRDYLFSVQKLKRKLTELQDAVLDMTAFFREEEKERFPEIKRSLAKHLQDIQEIRQEIRSNMENPKEDNSSLSSSEYSLLMDPEE